ncbi:MAG TPA: Holliday junction resolvase RuvX [Catalimonadaceae bacterium]|nr:Holliday junction resolvase RuvX [Catalimonadaceae bacterium]
MAAVLALDIGGKRTGMAVSDDNKVFAFPLYTVETRVLNESVKKVLAERTVDSLVLGMPKNLKNEETDNTQKVLKTLKSLQKLFPNLLIFTVDERFTSKMAQQAHIMGGMKKKDRQVKENTDTTSATLILQSFLEQKDRIQPEPK